MMGMLGIEEIGFSTRSSGAIGGSIGRYYYQRLRVELEYTYRENDFTDIGRSIYSDDLSTEQNNDTLISSQSMPADGTLHTHSFLANWVFDLKPRAVGCFNSYIGGGIGALYTDGLASTEMALFTFDDTAFAFQGIGGINYPIRERLDLFAEYRYTGANRLNVSRTNNVGTQNLGSFRFDSHNIFFGFRVLW